MLGLQRWRVKHLLAFWASYWVGLFAVRLGPVAWQVWKLSRINDDKSSVTFNFGDGGFHLDVVRSGVTQWSGGVGLTSLALLVAGPPLLLWGAWIVSRPRRNASPHPRLLPEPVALRPRTSAHPDEVRRNPPTEHS